MKPYYEHGGIQIYHGDCARVLPHLEQSDVLLTDPPYGIGADKNLRANKKHGKAATASRDYGGGDWDSTPPPQWLLEMAVDHAESAIVWGGNYFPLRPNSCWLVWDKENGDNGYADCELAWTNLPRAVRRIKYRWAGMLQEKMGEDKEPRFHPTQKPVAVMRWCLSFVPDAALVIDPWAGSGTTLVAARLEGRKAIGIEREERYCEIAANRLRQEVLF